MAKIHPVCVDFLSCEIKIAVIARYFLKEEVFYSSECFLGAFIGGGMCVLHEYNKCS